MTERGAAAPDPVSGRTAQGPGRPRLLLFLTTAALALAPAAFAQTFQGATTTNDNPPVTASMEAVFDTNVAGGDAAVAAARGLKPEDEIYTPNLSLNLTHQFGPQALMLSGDVGYDFYQHNTILNREHIDLQGGADGKFGRCGGGLFGSVDRHQSYLEDITVVGPLVSNTQTLNTIKFNGSCGGAIGFGPAISVTQGWQSNSTSSFQQFDYQQFTVTGSLVYQRPSFGQASAFVQYDEAQYPDQLLPLPGGASHVGNRYSLYSVGGRFERDIGARLSATVSGAYVWLRPLEGAEFTGFGYDADVTYRLFGRTDLHLIAERQAKPALLSDASFEVDDTYRAEANYAMGERVKLSLGASDERRHIGGAIGMPIEITDDHLQTIYSSARLDFARRFYVQLDARYEVRRANVVQLDYDSERVGLTLGAHL